MTEERMIREKEASLYIDLECCGCGRLVALVNMRHNGRHYYCGACEEKLGGDLMAIPSKKDPEMEKVIDAFNPSGRKRVGSIKADICSWCGGPATEFRDDLSRKEYTISGFCQTCQDKTFGR